MQKALLIIDMQVGSFTGVEPINDSDQLLANAKHLLSQARSQQVPIIFVQHCGGVGEVDEPDSPGWAIHPDLSYTSKDGVVQKRFPDAFQETGLQELLQTIQATQLVITGLQTEYCIDTTCRRAFSLGYTVTLAQDGHSTWHGDHLAANQIIAHHNQILGDWFVKLENTSDIQF